MRMIIRFIAALAAVAAFTVPNAAIAQDGPVGIAFAQAEEGTWWCRGNNATTALDCARAECNAGAGGQDCYRVAWCYPARWSGLMTVWLADFHTTEIVCGAPSLAALEHALEAFCAGNPYAVTCDVFMIIDPDGAETEAATTFTGGGGTTP